MTKSNTVYPTDLNDTEWAAIAQYLPKAQTTGRPRKYTWREILNAIFYITKNGCVWRALPKDLPPWETVFQDIENPRDVGAVEPGHSGGNSPERGERTTG
jgi:putative transposase